MAGLQFGRGGPLTGTVLLGWDEIDAEAPELEDFSDWVGEATLGYLLNSRTRLELEGERLPGFAVYGANSYFLFTNLLLRGVYFFNRRIGSDLALGKGRLTFPDSLNLLGREDRLWQYEWGIRLRMMENSMGRRVEYRFAVRYYNRESTLEAFDRNAFNAGFSAAVGF